MKISVKQLILTGTIILSFLVATSYWYVFIAGAPQLDPPATSVQGSGLTFSLQSFNSKSMGSLRQYGLILPPDYAQDQERRYPVIFLLHGGHDDARAWVDKYGLIPVLYQLYQSERLPRAIIITPDGNDQRGSSPLWDPDYYDGPNGQVGTLIGSELVQVVKSRYHTLNSPQFWAIGGLSSGGWGAVNIGLHHLNNFKILFSHSGYYTDSSGSVNSPQAFIKTLPKTQLESLRIYLDAGKADPDFLSETQRFHQTLNQLGVTNVFYTFPGGHGLSGADYGWNYFHKHVVDSLTYVGQQLKTTLKINFLLLGESLG